MSPETIDAMLAAGVTAEVLAAAWKAELVVQEAVLSERRAKDCERTALYRSRGGGNIPAELRLAVFERDKYSCQECSGEERLECDHIVPVSKGGETTEANLQVLCRSCNARKRDRTRKADVRANSNDVLGQGGTGRMSADPAPLEVPPENPLPNSPNQVFAPLNPPAPEVIFEEKKQAVASCLRVAFPCPDGVSSDQWAAFRSQRKKALSPRSYLLICNKLKTLAEAGWPPGDMIDLAIERGWETVFEPRNQANGQSASNVTSLRGSRPDPALDLLRAARAAEDREAHRGAGPSLPAIRSG